MQTLSENHPVIENKKILLIISMNYSYNAGALGGIKVLEP